MLQISAGRFFRPGAELNEYVHRRAFYTNAWFLEPQSIQLPVGTITASTERGDVSTVMVEVVDRLEKQRWDGTDDFHVATGGDELVNDVAYVMTFALNRTFTRNHDQVRRLVPPEGLTGRRRMADGLFPHLFEPNAVIAPEAWEDLRQFLEDLLAMPREDFARVMRAIRNSVDATRRAIDDPTGAYTDLVAALESLGDDELTTSVPWDRYDPVKRKIIDTVLADEVDELAEKMRTAVLAADRAGLKRRFVSSTLARLSPSYYRQEAVDTVRPPQSADIERMLGTAYDIRSRRSHVLQDLGEEAWVFTDGAETAYEPSFQRIFTLAGLWRLIRDVVRQYVAAATKTEPEPWDSRGSLPGVVNVQLAPQYWIWHPEGLAADTALQRFNGVAEAFIGWHAGHHDDGFNLTDVVKRIEQLVPQLPDGPQRTALVAIHVLWHEWTPAEDHRPEARDFIEQHGPCLEAPSPTAYAVGLLSNRKPPSWTADEWAEMAGARRAERLHGKEAPLPASVDTLIQLEAADQLEAVGRHDEAVAFAANAVEESPGHADVLQWEERLLAGEHDPSFHCQSFMFGTDPRSSNGDEEPSDSITTDADTSADQ
jgi:hypothetical protein